MGRYEKIVLEAEKGITFEVLKGTSGELIIRALNIATANVYSTNYVNPPIPEGYKEKLEVSTLMEHLMEKIFRRNSADGIIWTMNFRMMNSMKL